MSEIKTLPALHNSSRISNFGECYKYGIRLAINLEYKYV